MSRTLTIAPARPEERAAAFRLIFQHLSAEDRQTRVANALNLVRRGELEPDGILVARSQDCVMGALVCLPVPGASALFWPPQTRTGRRQQAIEDRLVSHAAAWLRGRGAKLAQALLVPEEASLAGPLERNGFVHITDLWYLRHYLDLSTAVLSASDRLRYQTYHQVDPGLFRETLAHTYDQTLDCPEVNGVRSLDEIIAGHLAQGTHRADRWWLALERDRPVGVVILTDVPDWDGWEVSYVGVVPAARRRGFGRELMVKALLEARAAEAAQLTLSVDARNHPAAELYRQLGFEPFDQRAVYLAIWQ